MFACSFAACWVALYTAHQVADHWVQTPGQAAGKDRPGWAGRRACAAHVSSYTATAVAALAVTGWMAGLHLSVAHVAAGLAVSAVSHYWADRRTTLARLAVWTGHGEFWRLGQPRHVGAQTASGEPVFLINQDHVPVALIDNPSLGTGAYALDQSWHIAWLWVAALITAGGVA